MPRLIQPRTRNDLRTWLEQCLGLAEVSERARTYIADHIPKLKELQQRLDAASHQEVIAHGERRDAVAHYRQLLLRLAKLTAHARRAIKLRIDTQDLSSTAVDHFGLRQQPPRSNSDRTWCLLAQDLIKGDKGAVADGYEPMAGPDAQQLASLLSEVKRANKAKDDWDQRLLQAQEELRTVGEEIKGTASDISACLRYVLNRRPNPTQRRIMRRFGFQYRDYKYNLITEEEPETIEDLLAEPTQQSS